jgi:hypothetical protein
MSNFEKVVAHFEQISDTVREDTSHCFIGFYNNGERTVVTGVGHAHDVIKAILTIIVQNDLEKVFVDMADRGMLEVLLRKAKRIHDSDSDDCKEEKESDEENETCPDCGEKHGDDVAHKMELLLDILQKIAKKVK